MIKLTVEIEHKDEVLVKGLLNRLGYSTLVIVDGYYKVVKPDLTSYLNSNPHNITYKIGEYVKPKIGKLFVFNSLEAAEKFVMSEWLSRNDYHIYKCDVINPVKAYSRATTISQAVDFWSGKSRYISESPVPDGTFYADEVKLTERVQC